MRYNLKVARAEKLGDNPPGIDPETESVLCAIDSGCLALLSGEKVVFAVKDFAIAFLFGGTFRPGVSFRFERVERDEFPAVCAVVSVDAAVGAGAGGKFGYEYFFSLESERDLEILSRLAGSSGVELWFLNGENIPETGFGCEFDAGEKKLLNESCRSPAQNGRPAV